MSADRYVYHYHATVQTVPGEIVHLDGILTRQNPIIDYADYSAVKELIATDGAPDRGFNPAKLTICSLNLIHTPEI